MWLTDEEKRVYAAYVLYKLYSFRSEYDKEIYVTEIEYSKNQGFLVKSLEDNDINSVLNYLGVKGT